MVLYLKSDVSGVQKDAGMPGPLQMTSVGLQGIVGEFVYVPCA
jgi:hypothetical protein